MLGHRGPAPRTTWRAALLFVAALVTGAGAIAGILSYARGRVSWTGGWPLGVYVSAVAAWGVLLLAAVQAWDLAQIGRHGAGFVVERGDGRLLPAWLQAWLPLAAPVAGFLVGWRLW